MAGEDPEKVGKRAVDSVVNTVIVPVTGVMPTLGDWKTERPDDLSIDSKRSRNSAFWKGRLALRPGDKVLHRTRPHDGLQGLTHLIVLPIKPSDFDRVVRDGTWVNRVTARWGNDSGPRTVEQALKVASSESQRYYLSPQQGKVNLADELLRLAGVGKRLWVPSKPGGGFAATILYGERPGRWFVTWIGHRTVVAHNDKLETIVANTRLVTTNLQPALKRESVLTVPADFDPYTLTDHKFGVFSRRRRRRR